MPTGGDTRAAHGPEAPDGRAKSARKVAKDDDMLGIRVLTVSLQIVLQATRPQAAEPPILTRP
jgi:hypothetical protein